MRSLNTTSLVDFGDHLSGTKTFEERQELDFCAGSVEGFALRLIQCVDRVVTGFSVDVGLELLDLMNEAWTVKDDDTVYAAECSETVGTFDFRLDRARWPFQ